MGDATLAAQIAALRTVWASVLELNADDIADTDDFFELGGDSMLALEAAVVSRRAGVSMPMTAVLRYPVLAGLAAAVYNGPDLVITDQP